MRKLLVVLLLIASAAFAIDKQSPQDYRSRRERLAKAVKEADAIVVFAALESSDALPGFRQDEDFYYLTGWEFPGAAVLIVPAADAKDGVPARAYSEIFFLPKHNTIMEHWTGARIGPENSKAPSATGFEHVEALDQLRDELAKVTPNHGGPTQGTKIYTVLPKDSASDNAIALHWLARANAFRSYNGLQDASKDIARLRMVKDAGEMTLIRHAVDASMAAHKAALQAMKPGAKEIEIAKLIEYEYGRRGCERPAYGSIVGTGFDSTVLHYDAGAVTIQDGDIVVIDAAGEYSGYASDITRTMPANGHFTPRQREIYDIVLGAQQAAIDAFQAGKFTLKTGAPDSLYKIAYDYINTHGKDQHGEPLGKYFIHGLGHHVGLNVHDPADYDQKIDRGMVFTIEPGIYIPEEKLGVRIEDDFWVDDTGKLVMLSAGLPRTADEVEAAMKPAAPTPPPRKNKKK